MHSSLSPDGRGLMKILHLGLSVSKFLYSVMLFVFE